MSLYTIAFILFALFVWTITAIAIWYQLHPPEDDGPDYGDEPESPHPPFDFDWHTDFDFDWHARTTFNDPLPEKVT